eukprot:6590644-Pyramimonas_sp.AAC.1
MLILRGLLQAQEKSAAQFESLSAPLIVRDGFNQGIAEMKCLGRQGHRNCTPVAHRSTMHELQR